MIVTASTFAVNLDWWIDLGVSAEEFVPVVDITSRPVPQGITERDEKWKDIATISCSQAGKYPLKPWPNHAVNSDAPIKVFVLINITGGTPVTSFR